MAEPVDPEKLTSRVWAYVESQENAMVYAPAESGTASRSRAQITIQFEPSGRLIMAGPGPSDRPTQTEGTWEVQGDEIVLTLPGPTPDQPALRFASLDGDQLHLRA